MYFAFECGCVFCRHYLTTFLLVSFISFLQVTLPNDVLAESLSTCGLTIQLDALEPIDPENVKVALGSEVSIIARRNLDHWVAERIILNTSLRTQLSTKQLANFAFLCLEKASLTVEASALKEIFGRGEEKSFSARQFLAKSAIAKEVLAATLESGDWENSIKEKRMPGQIRLIAEALAELVVVEPQTIKTKFLRLYYLLSEAISSVLFERFREELANENVSYLSQLKSSIDLFGEEGSGNTYILKQASTLAETIVQEPFNLESIRSVLSVIQGNAQLNNSERLLDLLYPKISARVIREISQLLEANNLDDALKCVSLLLPAKLSPDTIIIILELLDKVTLRPIVSVEDSILNIFDSFSNSNPAISSRYEYFLEDRFSRLLESNELADSEKILSHLVRIRPDPNIKNDSKRFKLALLYKQQGLNIKSAEQSEQMKTGISILQSLQLFFIGGIFGGLSSVLVGLSILSVVGLLLYKSGLIKSFAAGLLGVFTKGAVSGQQQYSSSNNSKKKVKSAKDGDESEAAIFLRMDRMRAINPLQIQYEKNLALLGLGAAVNMRAIKAAYRSAVKECHPDLNPKQSKQQTQHFSDLTKLYEEIIELRKQLGLVD